MPYHRLFVTSVAYSLGIEDLRAVFEPFGELEFVDLHTDYVSGHGTISRGCSNLGGCGMLIKFRLVRAKEPLMCSSASFARRRWLSTR